MAAVTDNLEQSPDWIVCQIGAREHYVIASGLHQRGRLHAFAADMWCKPGSALDLASRHLGPAGSRLRDRYDPRLADVITMTPPLLSGLTYSVAERLHAPSMWARIIQRNKRFGQSIARQIRECIEQSPKPENVTVFAYSYAALEIFEAARECGARTVLGQIDPGPTEDELIAQIARQHGMETSQQRPPETYWIDWKKECELADRIVVNSRWSAEGLIKAGIKPDKLAVVPLAFEVPAHSGQCKPDRHQSGPLRLLFLGQPIVRKGVIELLDAMAGLQDMPIELTIVGATPAWLVERYGTLSNVRWQGLVPRSRTEEFYQQSDVFVLPTHSDGFAITQLEAAAHNLPVLASRHCGDWVIEGRTGWLLDSVDAKTMSAAILNILDRRDTLTDMIPSIKAELERFKPSVVIQALIDAAK
jgi:glycosyltransferase involved in cell wall biosynthesis